MAEIVLKAEPRQIVGKQVKSLRREGRLPGVIYGNGIEPVLITLDLREASRILPTITSSHLIVVDVDGKNHNTLVRERQRQPVNGKYLHVDFLEVSLTEKLRTSVPVVLEGESPAVKNYNGILFTALEALEIEALPRDLPERIVVDVSILTETGQSLRVRDLKFSTAVEVLTDADETVVVVMAPAVEEAAEVEEVAEIEPEVIERGRKEDEF